MTIASGFLAATSARSSRTRSKLSAGGEGSSWLTTRTAPVQVDSQSSTTLRKITSQPRPRRGSSSRAPMRTRRSRGTGGRISAVSTGFHDSIPSDTKRLFTGADSRPGSGAIVPAACRARRDVASCCFVFSSEPLMNERAQRLRDQLIRNFDELPKERELRAPLYDTVCARLARGTAARALGMSIDIVAPGMRGCPYHLHHAQ